MSTSNQRPISNIIIPWLLFVVIFSLYAATATPATLFGDPSEHQFVPAILGIAHPPGYVFYILLAKLWQTCVPVGTVAYRTNLLAAAAGAWIVTVIYLLVRDYTFETTDSQLQSPISKLPPLFAALSLATAPDLWQHAIHSNAHIISTALVTTHLWLLIRWWRTGRDRWLGTFALTLGWAAAHHPITLLGVPAYGLFILAVRPQILRQWRVLLLLIGCLMLGLTPFLYYPLRSPSAPFGPTDMRTWEGFLGHITAQGLRSNLFHFALADLPDRVHVFWSLLRLQFHLAVIVLIVVGIIYLIHRASKPGLLLGLFLLGHLAFTLNTIQDVMAYLLLPFVALSVVAGIGALALAELFVHTVHRSHPVSHTLPSYIVEWSLVILLLPWPLLQAITDLQQGISLRDFVDAEEYTAAIYDRFAGRGEGAVLLSDWEHLTPLWVHIHTQGESLNEEDVKLVYITSTNPWVESVWQYIEEAPVYMVGYRPEVRDAGFRLVPEASLWRVVFPPVTDAVPTHPLDIWVTDRVHILGYDLPMTTIRAGDPLVLTIYQSVPELMEDIWMPYAQLGPIEARWTTDSRLLTTQWLPGEVAVERYELPVPFFLTPGEYPLKLGYVDLTGGKVKLALSTGEDMVELTTVTVLPNADAPSTKMLEQVLANLNNEVALMGAQAQAGGQTRWDHWEEPLVVQPGQLIRLSLTWSALVTPRGNYTVFIHLIDGANRRVFGYDYNPLGAACPTYLWFPKWLPGQILSDPYRLDIPADLPAGNYWLEVGLYEMGSIRRLPMVDLAGNLAGDRIVLGPVQVEQHFKDSSR